MSAVEVVRKLEGGKVEANKLRFFIGFVCFGADGEICIAVVTVVVVGGHGELHTEAALCGDLVNAVGRSPTHYP